QEAAKNWGQPNQAFPFMNYTTESTIRWEIDSFFQSNTSLSPVLIGETDDPTFMKEMTLEGQCLAFLPDEMIKHELEEGELSKIESVPPLQNRVSILFQEMENRDYVKAAINALSSRASPGEVEP